MDKEMIKMLFTKMYKIRRFEETILKLFSENELSGTTHTCIGQEVCAVTALANIKKNDIVFSNHRCHGHFIAYSDNIEILLAEIMGKENGVCKGKGGSQHLCYRRFFSNGIQGGIVPNAVGMAWAEKIKGTENIAIVFIGDGTLGEGVVYESLNMASVYEIPILFVIENNEYAMSTKRKDVLAGTIKGRLEAFSIECIETDDQDIERLYHAFETSILYVRTQKKPFCQIVNTYRLAAHSKGDDFRDPTEIKEHWEKDPLKKMEKLLNSQERECVKKEIDSELENVVERCRKAKNGYEKKYQGYSICENIASGESMLNREPLKNILQLNEALKKCVHDNKNVMLIGEDIKDPYGGAFKATRGISEKYPKQVINTPISEAGFIGISVGLAMNGIRPIVEIMFGDFISLGFDQILNHAVKYNWMYNGQIEVPILIRIPSGGGRGYGATHSQSLEKYFVGIPQLDILALSPIIDCRKLITRITDTIKNPTLLIENKKMYGRQQMAVDNGRADKFFVAESKHMFPIYKLYLDKEEKADGLIITYGEALTLAMETAKSLLIEEELLINIVSLTKISPIDYDQLIDCIENEKYIFTLEEGTKRAGWGAEIVSGLCERSYQHIFHRIGAKDCAISCNREEEMEILPNDYSVINEIKEVIYGTVDKNAQDYK